MHTARHAERIPRCTTPGENDTVADFRHYARCGMCVSIPENSRWSEGIDSPEFEMGALYNGHFATPVEDFIGQTTGDWSYKESELVRAAQNAILRASDTPDAGTGPTPVIVPTRHVPSGTFEMLERFGILVYEPEFGMVEIRRFLVRILGVKDQAVEHDGRIIAASQAPVKARPFSELLDS